MKKLLIINLLFFSICLINGQTTVVSVTGTQIQTEKVFDNTTIAAVINPGTLSGVAAGDSVGLAVSANYEHANADSSIKIIVRYALTGPDAARYAVDTVDTLYDGIITKRQLYRDSIILDSIKIYDGNTNCNMLFSGVARNYVTHHILTQIDSVRFEDPNVGNNKPVHIYFGMSGEDYDNYLPPHDTVLHATIIPLIPVISGTKVSMTKIYDGTSAAEVTDTGSIRGIVWGDTVMFRIVSSVYEDKDVGKGKSINVYYQLYGKDVSNYQTPNHAYFLNCEIEPIRLKTQGGSVECSKDYDSTTHAVVTIPAQPVGVLSDEQVYLTTNAEFEDTEPGTGKMVYCWFTIYGRDMANYIAPEDSVVCTDGEIRGGVDSAVEQVEVNEKMSPNPARDIVYVEGEQVTIYNLTGVKVYAGNGGMIDVSRLPEGIYIVRRTNGKGEKLIICR